jgi:malonyl-CoA O-methyltransferase
VSAQAFYSRLAAWYDLGLRLNGYRRAARFLARQLPLATQAPLTVLDAGCGTGLYALAILKRFPRARVFAADINVAMVTQMKKHLKRHGWEARACVTVADVLGDLTELEPPVDLVVTGGVLEYVDLRRAVRQLARYLRPGGHFLNAPVRDNLAGTLVGRWAGFKPYPARENVAAFAENGLVLLQTWRLPWRFFPISLVKEAHLFRSQRWPG